MKDVSAIQSLLDRNMIVDVAIRYAWAIDTRQWDSFLSCLTDHVHFSSPLTNGWIKLKKSDMALICSRIFPLFTATQHISANHQVTISGDEATCISTLNATHYDADAVGGTTQRQVGHYEYHLIRDDGWKIDRMTQVIAWEEGNQRVFYDAYEKSGFATIVEGIIANSR
jgi:hypothetical protein